MLDQAELVALVEIQLSQNFFPPKFQGFVVTEEGIRDKNWSFDRIIKKISGERKDKQERKKRKIFI